jgi:hypothetical protein
MRPLVSSGLFTNRGGLSGLLGESAFARSVYAAPLCFCVVLLGIFGYEIFGFHLSMDEGTVGSANKYLVAQHLKLGRWFAAAVVLLFPVPVAPVVPIAVGVVLVGLTFWFTSRLILRLNRFESLLAASVASSTPLLASNFSFAFAAPTMGFAYFSIFLTLWVRQRTVEKFSQKRRWLSVLLPALAGACAVSIFEPMAIALAIGLLIPILATPNFSEVLRSGAILAASVLMNAVVVQGLAVFVEPTPYSTSLVDWRGFVADPTHQLALATNDMLAVLDGTRFLPNHGSQVTVIVWVFTLVVAVFGAVSAATSAKTRVIAISALLLVPALPLLVEIAASPLLMRSMVYFPWAQLVLAGTALYSIDFVTKGLRRLVGLILVVGLALVVMAGATFSNRLYAMSALAYEYDQMMAYEINREIAIQSGGQPNDLLPVVTRGQWDMNRNPNSFWLPRSRDNEAHGSSFFYRLPEYRIVPFLVSQGLPVKRGTQAQAEELSQILDQMPPWPQEGWLRFVEGVVLIKLS